MQDLRGQVSQLQSQLSQMQSQLGKINELQSQISRITELQNRVTKLEQAKPAAASAGASAGAAAAATRQAAARQQPAPRQQAAPRAKTATVTYDFQGDPGQGSMTVSAGEKLNYEGNPSDDWIMCTRPSTGEQGYVPNTYLQF